MHDTTIKFDGVTLKSDPAGASHVALGEEALMFFMQEEQPTLWQWMKPQIQKVLDTAKGEVNFLDIGTGSGIFAVLFKKHFGGNIIACDPNPRAIEIAQSNETANGLSGICFKHEAYTTETASKGSVKILVANPPYHVYPREVEEQIPLHARGGDLGQWLFMDFLDTANFHLAKNGALFFHMACLGTQEGPSFLNYALKEVKNSSLTWMNVMPPIATQDFLTGIYGDRHPDFVASVSNTYPLYYLTNGVIIRDGKGEIYPVGHTIDICGRTWQDRLDAHKAVADHE